MPDNAHVVLPEAPFGDPERARTNLELIGTRVPPGILQAIRALLADVPDPDGSLNLFERLTQSSGPELFRALDRDRILVHYALATFGFSQFLGETLIQNTDLFHTLQRDKMLDRSRSREEYREAFARFRSRSFETDIALLLARFKRREYVRIMLRDILGIATLAEITAEISALADVLIDEALRETDSAFRNRYGAPQFRDADGRLVDVPVAVLSLGKLGGNELNYSSDIDLLFIYGDGQDAGTASISNREYFIRMAQTVTDSLSRMTREGSAFRVDLRLRPQGGEGEPAVGLRHALHYYEHFAGDWERQALIKVRHSAGDVPLARRFIRAVQPFVYAEQINFAAIETALQARDRIGAHRRFATARSDSLDVKLDRGGIRDIEFLVQCLQRVYGGKERWLRSGGTLFSLQKLHDKGHISGREFHELTTAYEFLRRLEHRLQLRHGQQTHKLPQSPAELAVLTRAMQSARGERASLPLTEVVQLRMAAVAEIYNRIIHHQQTRQHADAPEFQLETQVGGREYSERQMLARLSEDAPALHDLASNPSLNAQTRRNLFRFLSSAFTSSDRYRAVVESPGAVERALQLFRSSDYLTDILSRHPEEISTLDRISAAPAQRAEPLFEHAIWRRNDTADVVFHYLSSSAEPYNEKLALLRRHYRHRIFASGSRDLLEHRNVFESLADTTAAAEEAVVAALAIAGNPKSLAVLALGRLGSCEFDVLSDADLIFVHDPLLDAPAASHVAEQMMQTLSAYTREGTVFAVDLRLRPHGGEGDLVITPAGLEQYFLSEAQAWEALSYTKLRHIAGDKCLGQRAISAVAAFHERFATMENFGREVHEMRAKLEESDPEFNLKTSAGGVYDIDFVISALAVRHGVIGLCGNFRQRLGFLSDRGLLPPAQAAQLAKAAEFLRALDHVIRLVTGRPRKNLPVGEHARLATERLVARILRRDLREGLEAELQLTLQDTRQLYEGIEL